MIEEVEIKGKCPVHKLRDRIVIDGRNIYLERTDDLCIHTLSSLLHCVLALIEGVDATKLELSKDNESAYIQCLDSGAPYTDGRTVIF